MESATSPSRAAPAPAGLQLVDSPSKAAARRTRGLPAAPPFCAAITGSHRAFSQARRPRPFCQRRQSRSRSTKVAAPGSRPALAPELGELPAETVTSPAYPTPARVRWLPRRRRRALPVSGSAVTRAALAPPRATSPAPRAGRSLSTKQRGPGMSWSPPGLDQARQAGGPRAEATVTKRLLCRPTRPAAAAETAPARRTGPAALAQPHRPRHLGLGGDQEAGASHGQPLPRSPQRPLARSRPQPAGHRAAARSPLTQDTSELRAGTVGSGSRALNKGDGGDGGAGRGAPAREATVRRVLTGICLLIEDCGLIIQPVPRRRRHRRRWRRLQGRGWRWSWRGGGGFADGGGGTRLYHAVSSAEESA